MTDNRKIVVHWLQTLTTDTARAFQWLQFVRLFAAILLGIFLVRILPSQEEVGQVECFLFLAHGLTFFWSQGMKDSMLSYFTDKTEKQQNGYLLKLSALFFSIALVTGLIITIFFNSQLDIGNYPLILSGYILFNIPSSLIEQWYMIKRKAKALFVYGSLVYFLYLFIPLLTWTLIGGIWGVCIGFLVWSCIRICWLLLVLFQSIKAFEQVSIKPFVLFSLPLIGQVLLGSGMEFLDGFIVKYLTDDALFAVFRYGARELPLNTIVITAFSMSMIPLAVKNLHQTLEQVRRRVIVIMKWLFPLSMLLMILSPFLFHALYGDAYHLSAIIFNIYLLIISSRILIPQLVLYAEKENVLLLKVAFFELTVNLLSSLSLFYFFGLIGIAVGTIIAYSSQKIVMVVVMKRKFNISLDELIDVALYIKYLIGILIVFLISIWIAISAI